MTRKVLVGKCYIGMTARGFIARRVQSNNSVQELTSVTERAGV